MAVAKQKKAATGKPRGTGTEKKKVGRGTAKMG
jgi:hypothetical protein